MEKPSYRQSPEDWNNIRKTLDMLWSPDTSDDTSVLMSLYVSLV